VELWGPERRRGTEDDARRRVSGWRFLSHPQLMCRRQPVGRLQTPTGKAQAERKAVVFRASASIFNENRSQYERRRAGKTTLIGSGSPDARAKTWLLSPARLTAHTLMLIGSLVGLFGGCRIVTALPSRWWGPPSYAGPLIMVIICVSAAMMVSTLSSPWRGTIPSVITADESGLVLSGRTPVRRLSWDELVGCEALCFGSLMMLKLRKQTSVLLNLAGYSRRERREIRGAVRRRTWHSQETGASAN